MKTRYMKTATSMAAIVGIVTLISNITARVSAAEIGPMSLDPELPTYRVQTRVSGHLTALAYDNTDEITGELFELLHRDQPGISGTFTKMPDPWPQNTRNLIPLVSQVSVIVAKRLPRPEEEQYFKARTGYPIQVVAIGESAVWAEDGGAHVYGIVVNKDNPLKQITLDQVDAIYSQNRLRGYPEAITTWGQLGVTDPKFANERIHAYGRDRLGDPAFDFMNLAMGGGDYKKDFYYSVPTLEVAAADVIEDPYGIAYVDPPNFDRTGLHTVAIAEHAGGPYIAEKWNNIISHRYPLVKHEYVYLNHRPGTPLDPATKEFLRLALSKAGQSILLKNRFMPLNAAEVRAQLQKLEIKQP